MRTNFLPLWLGLVAWFLVATVVLSTISRTHLEPRALPHAKTRP